MTETGASLESILYFLNERLDIPAFPDFDGAQNGLQVSGRDRVERIGAAVDASIETIEEAVARDIHLLLVHHGLYWDGLRPLTGRSYRRVAPLVRANAALYSAHLPLDANPEIGNCALLVRALGLAPEERFGTFAGVPIGFATRTDESREGLQARVVEVVGGPVRVIAGGPARVRRVGVITGGGADFVAEAAEAGLDTLLTGEGKHHTYLDAHELGVNVLLAGHYATETFGVKALAEAVQAEFGIPWEFLDFPTGF